MCEKLNRIVEGLNEVLRKLLGVMHLFKLGLLIQILGLYGHSKRVDSIRCLVHWSTLSIFDLKFTWKKDAYGCVLEHILVF
mgnify:CR=1 FL=1